MANTRGRYYGLLWPSLSASKTRIRMLPSSCPVRYSPIRQSTTRMPPPNIKNILTSAKVVAVVGCSDKRWRDSHQIARYLQEHGYRMIPVNPHLTSVLGETAYPDLLHIPEDIHIDIVDIFRRPAYTADVVDQTLARMEKTGETPVVWTQLGVSSYEAQQKAEAEALPYIEDNCIKVVHARLFR